MRLVCLLSALLHTYSIRKFSTCTLKSQFNTRVNWGDYTYIIICDKNSHSYGLEWGESFLKDGINTKSICVIAPVPKWMTKTIGHKTIIRNAVKKLEKKVPVFIDWKQEIVELNDIDKLPTIISVFKGNDGKLYEKQRVTGKYTRKKYKKLYSK